MLVVQSRKPIMALKYQTLTKKYFTASDYNKFTEVLLPAKTKEKELIVKYDLSNLRKNFVLNTKLVAWQLVTDNTRVKQ